MDPETERGLVARLRAGDAAAFDAVWDRFRPRVYGFLARLSGRRDLAEDLLQETFLRLAARAPSLAEDTRLGPWLFTVARNLFVSERRAALLDAERIDRLALADPERARPATPFEEAAAGESARRLERALAALPDTYREVLLLVAVERLEPREAAQVLSITPEALRQRLARARALLEDALADRGKMARHAG